MCLSRLRSILIALVLFALATAASAVPIHASGSSTFLADSAGTTYAADPAGIGAKLENDLSFRLESGDRVENLVMGIGTPIGAAGDPWTDAGSESSASFERRLNAIPTTTSVYSLDLDRLDPIRGASDVHTNAEWLARLKDRFRRVSGTAVPEPSAAILFGVGLLVAHVGLRRRR
jgi:PEP-CTERM motif